MNSRKMLIVIVPDWAYETVREISAVRGRIHGMIVTSMVPNAPFAHNSVEGYVRFTTADSASVLVRVDVAESGRTYFVLESAHDENEENIYDEVEDILLGSCSMTCTDNFAEEVESIAAALSVFFDAERD